MISPLQWGLLLLGILVVLGVFVYNRWATARLAPRAVPRDADSAQANPASDGLEGRLEPTLGAEAQADAAHAASVVPLSDTLDVLVPLSADAPVLAEAVLAALPGTHRIGGKRLLLEALHPQTGLWAFPQPGQRYAMLRAGIQLASRSGPLNDIEFSEFVVKVQALADALHLSADFPDMLSEVARARALDRWASEHDAQLSLTVQAVRVAWSPAYLSQYAAQEGFVPGPLPGRMVLPGAFSGAAPLLTLRFEAQAAWAEDPDQAALRAFALTLDVPHVPSEEQPFARMREIAQRLALAMEGVVTDAQGQRLDEPAMDEIAASLETLYERLQRSGMPAGAPLARRLFS
jgi:hypothetical protein